MDRITRAIAFDDTVRITAVVTTGVVDDAMRIHGTSPTASAALGRLLTGTLLLATTVKDNVRLTLQLQGGGPFGLMLARTGGPGEVYGTMQNPGQVIPPREDGKLDVGAGVGRDGQLMVIKDLGLREPYVGATPVVSGEIGDELTLYLANSEQVQSAVGVGVLVTPDAACSGAGGFLVQVLGGASDDALDALESRLVEFKALSREIAAGASTEELIKRLSGGDHRVLDDQPVAYRCPLDRAYYLERLQSLGSDALGEAFADDPSIEVTCEFSRQTYTFERSEFGGLV